MVLVVIRVVVLVVLTIFLMSFNHFLLEIVIVFVLCILFLVNMVELNNHSGGVFINSVMLLCFFFTPSHLGQKTLTTDFKLNTA